METAGNTTPSPTLARTVDYTDQPPNNILAHHTSPFRNVSSHEKASKRLAPAPHLWRQADVRLDAADRATDTPPTARIY